MEQEELSAFYKAYGESTSVASIFPVNEDENMRLRELAKYIWNASKTYNSTKGM